MSSNWQQKLKDHSEAPPTSAWNAIAERLDAQEASFPQKLFDYEAAPPATAWEKIEQELPATKQTKVVPLKWLRYAAAAVILLALAGIAFWAAPDNTTAVANTAATVPGLNKTKDATPKREIKHFNVPPQPATASAAIQDEPKRPRLQYAAAAAKQIPARRTQVSLPDEPEFAAELDIVPKAKNIINIERANRYMVAAPEEGPPVRLPKKMYSAFACPDEEAGSQACELKLALLQQKISTSFTTDFAHFLDLLKNLQENSK